MADEQIASLNQIVAIIDEKAAKYKDEVFDMPEVRARAEKKLILDLIVDGLDLAETVSPRPLDLIDDLRRLQSQLQNMA
ncbi:MAG: hypothetical protein KDK37_16890 [Leptospiraceae bacterium]|nr:hypothetical protein [Leptospiraceae bacterium]